MSLEHAQDVTLLGDVVFYNDGAVPMPEDRLALMTRRGEVTSLPGVGNSRSYRRALAEVEARAWSSDDLVYFVEDDYLHTEAAVRSLVLAAVGIREGGFFTAYDHPDYGRLQRHRRYIATHRHTRTVDGLEWRAVRSTTMTFLARVGAIRRHY